MKAFLYLVLTVFFLFFVQAVEAKVLPQAKSGTVVKSAGGSRISVYPKLRADRRALNVSFSNLQNASLVSYLLIYKHSFEGFDPYKTNGQEEGAMGGIKLNSKSTSQELLFGTCSKNVCRYHTGITDARLEVSYTLKNGKKYLKKYKIKV